MTNGNGETGGGRLEREASPAGAQDPPEMAGKGKGMRLRLSMQFFTHPLSQINLKISSTALVSLFDINGCEISLPTLYLPQMADPPNPVTFAKYDNNIAIFI